MMKKHLIPLSSLLITALLMTSYMLLRGYAPFGIKTLASHDAYIQYLELFAHFKDILEGQASLASSFAKGIGGEGIGVYSYYLASPWSLLVTFFSKSSLPAFYNMLVIIKLSLASCLMTYYLDKRFALKGLLSCLLGLSYGLSQYGLAQSISMMWLDGMYMMPLIMLGIDRCLRGKKIALLSISVGLAIIFNWYAGAICALMSILVCALELLLQYCDDHQLKALFSSLGRYIFAMIAGVMICGILFIPTVLAMTTNSRSSFDFSLLAPTLRASMVTLVSSYYLGAQSTEQVVSLYMGTLPLAGTLATLYARHITKSEKLVIVLFLLMIVLCFYFQPFYMVFSLFVKPGSFWCRFSYIGTASLAMIAGFYFSRRKSDDAPITYGLLAFMGCFLLLSYKNITALKAITLAMMLLIGLLYDMSKDRKVFMCVMSVLCVSELTINMHELFASMKNNESDHFAQYVQAGLKQKQALIHYDDSYYRINQTEGMLTSPLHTSAYLNDGYLFHEPTVTSYVSAQSSRTLEMLDHLGYRQVASRMTIVTNSVLTADSLLGVKYVLSKAPLEGFNKTTIPLYNGRRVYENPYVLPLAFTYKNQPKRWSHRNLFTYTNALYSMLAGKKMTLYKKCHYTKQVGDHKVTYTITKPKDSILYGNIYTAKHMLGALHLGKIKQGYSSFLGPSVFYVPGNKVTYTYQKQAKFSEDFYALDINAFKQASQRIQKNKAHIMYFKDGNVQVKVNAKKQTSLFLSIPADANWEAYIDGKKVTIQKVDQTFMSISLTQGSHTITLKAHIRGFMLGLCASLTGFLLIIFYSVLRKEKHYA